MTTLRHMYVREKRLKYSFFGHFWKGDEKTICAKIMYSYRLAYSPAGTRQIAREFLQSLDAGVFQTERRIMLDQRS